MIIPSGSSAVSFSMQSLLSLAASSSMLSLLCCLHFGLMILRSSVPVFLLVIILFFLLSFPYLLPRRHLHYIVVFRLPSILFVLEVNQFSILPNSRSSHFLFVHVLIGNFLLFINFIIRSFAPSSFIEPACYPLVVATCV